MKEIIKNIFLYIFVFLLCLALFSTYWALKTFNIMNFDEVIFQLTTPIKSASSSILNSFITDSLFRSILLSIPIFIVLALLFHYLTCKSIEFDIKIWKKNINFSIKGIVLKRIIKVLIFIITILIVYHCLDKILFINYVKAQMNPSTFIEENYVEPRDVKITFPEKKRNLIYIYLESMESTYFSKELGGSSDVNYIEPLNEITKNNISFSDGNKFGGAKKAKGTEWTSGAMVAHTSGLPLKNSLDNISGMQSMLSNAYTLGDILHNEGYNQMIMFGSDKNFGNRGTYFETHGDYEVYDYNTAIKKGKIDKDYYVWWGFEDTKLFEYAKEEITDLAKEDKPFNFTMLTVDTHTVDGYLEESCPATYGNHYLNVVHCSSMQVADFVKWIKEQDFYDNTTVILVGDHISMQEGLYPKGTRRGVYNVFINSYVTEGRFKNRVFNTMDFYPTTLASLGVKIEGDRLALGTNLFSNKDTLMEEVGAKKFNEEVQKYSKFYMEKFYYS